LLTKDEARRIAATPPSHNHWRQASAGMIAIDSLVHNFLHRTGILHRRKLLRWSV
jgi:hypothetical protein